MVRAAHERTSRFYVGVFVWVATVVWLVSVGLGVVAFVASALLGIWVFGLSERFESEETESAYSVFNRGGAAILGGFTGQQLERQLRGGIGPEEEEEDTVVRGHAPLVTRTLKKALSDKEKLRRRSAAAAAAERRKEKQEQM